MVNVRNTSSGGVTAVPSGIVGPEGAGNSLVQPKQGEIDGFVTGHVLGSVKGFSLSFCAIAANRLLVTEIEDCIGRIGGGFYTVVGGKQKRIAVLGGIIYQVGSAIERSVNNHQANGILLGPGERVTGNIYLAYRGFANCA